MTDAIKTMRKFIEHQSIKLGEINSSSQFRLGYGSALKGMSMVLDAITELTTTNGSNDDRTAGKANDNLS